MGIWEPVYWILPQAQLPSMIVGSVLDGVMVGSMVMIYASKTDIPVRHEEAYIHRNPQAKVLSRKACLGHFLSANSILASSFRRIFFGQLTPRPNQLADGTYGGQREGDVE
jgi:hypothetical protein